MLNLFKKLLRNYVFKNGFYISRIVDREKLDDFFDLIKKNQLRCELIRIGAKGDGGYLLPNDLDGVDECFSPGVSVVADFEAELVDRKIYCYLADYSICESPILHDLIDFEKKYVGLVDNDKYFRLDTWVRDKSKFNSDLILQMDIEGNEYGVLMDSSIEVLRRFRIIIIEFHHLNRLFEDFGFGLIDLVFRKILKEFNIVHIHPNNCRESITHFSYSIPPVMEFTFLRKDRNNSNMDGGIFPNNLDIKNISCKPDVDLPLCWRK